MVLYNGMASTSPCAALYFVALMTFGNYVLFNLLVAILVEGFQAEVRHLFSMLCSVHLQKTNRSNERKLYIITYFLAFALSKMMQNMIVDSKMS